MNSVLIISFDIIREGECSKSYSIASLLAYIKANMGVKRKITHKTFNVLDSVFESNLFEWIKSTDFKEYSHIAISNYVWSEYIIGKVLTLIDEKFNGFIILGGNQITYSNELPKEYPECNVFISGFGEKALLESLNLNTKSKYPKIITGKNILKELPSPYLTGELIISENQKMVRMESKRGCIFSCNFCAHKELYKSRNTKVLEFPIERVFSELDLFKKYNVGKINFIDPIFNYGENYLNILKYIIQTNIESKIALQTKFELINGKKGEEFLNLCSKINVVLEFGLQTVYEDEFKAIKRSNKIKHVTEIIKSLNKREIDYEVNIIYGLPRQTIESFNGTIKYLQSINCKKIVAHPLMLLKGTELYDQRNSLKLKDEIIDGFHFPLVTESESFSRSEWHQMKKIAKEI